MFPDLKKYVKRPAGGRLLFRQAVVRKALSLLFYQIAIFIKGFLLTN